VFVVTLHLYITKFCYIECIVCVCIHTTYIETNQRPKVNRFNVNDKHFTILCPTTSEKDRGEV
jgi:hypothetical protein